ncbi:MAG TPA: S9 family peptidase [Thermoanaerobaculia bacterium]|nr:S9 family peptidase [Thermoanaerobaculia bacterium]
MRSILRNRCVAAAVVALVFLAGLLAAPHALLAAKRPITETDLFKFVWTADPQISPDGRQVVYVRVIVNEKKEGYDTALWIAPADGSEPPRPFTSGPSDSSPKWSPDGSRLAFVRSVRKDGKGQPPQIYVIPTQGGEAAALTDLPDGAGAPLWSPDSRTIAFASALNEKDVKKWRAKAKARAGAKDDAKDEETKAGEEHESDVRVITKARYRFNGGGYDDPNRPAHVWAVPVPAAGFTTPPEPRQLTSGEYQEGAAFWSPDSKVLYYASRHDLEPYYSPAHIDLYALPAQGGESRRIWGFDGFLQEAALSPDGRSIASAGVADVKPERSFNQPDLFVLDLAADPKPRNLTANLDADVGEGLGSDQHAPRGGDPLPAVWSADGHSVIAAVAERGRTNLMRFDAKTGAATPITHGDQEVVTYSASADGSRLALVISTPTVLGDLYSLDVASGRLTPLAHPNEELFSQLDLTPPEEITYKSFDGREIHAFVQKPVDYVEGKKYPLILNIHGGPHSAYGYTFVHEMQWMAAKGYVVLYPNPRGSSTYGQEFGNVIQFNFPGDDAKDLLAGVDEMVKRGIADPKRLGVTGGSGGGILTNWIVTQDHRFAAAAAQRSIADWSSFFYTADFTLFRPTWFHGAPWENPDDFARLSPITYIAQVTTPLMLIEGEADYRTPPASGGEEMFRALKYLHKPTVMIRFPGESHELSRSGQPWHRVERLRHIVAWMDKYLQGKKTDAYDVR